MLFRFLLGSDHCSRSSYLPAVNARFEVRRTGQATAPSVLKSLLETKPAEATRRVWTDDIRRVMLDGGRQNSMDPLDCQLCLVNLAPQPAYT
jgi:hypothetical protein